MPVNIQGLGGNLVGRNNATADTVFYAVVPGKKGALTAVTLFSLTSGNTANVGYWMRPLARANCTAAQTTSDSTVTLDADPSPTGNTIAAGDQVVILHSDGTYRRSQVNTSGWCSTTKVLTFTAALPAAVSVGSPLWNFGIFSDTDPATGVAHPGVASVVNTRQEFRFQAGGVKTHQPNDPLLFYCPNATNATVLDFAEYVHRVE